MMMVPQVLGVDDAAARFIPEIHLRLNRGIDLLHRFGNGGTS
jgi:hypothetical protein